MKKTTSIALLSMLLGTCPLLRADFAGFISTNVPAIPLDKQGEADDPDEDGVPSVIEYWVKDMNPGVKDTGLLPEPVISGGEFIYAVPKRAGISGVTAEIRTYDGTDWVVASGVTEDSDFITLVATVPPGSHILARLEVNTSGGCVLPPNNPVAQQYPDEYCSSEYAWTDAFNWDNVIDVTQAPYNAVADGDFDNSFGTDNHAAITAAMAAAAAGGGGVVYFPSGVYYVGDHLLIPPGVVLRGADLPSGADSGRDNTLNPPSKLVFPKYLPSFSGSGTPSSTAFKKIYSDALAQLDASDTAPIDHAAHGTIGIVNMDINRAPIIFDTPDANPIRTGGAYSGKSDALLLTPFLSPSGVGKNFLVLNVRSNNSATSWGAEGVRVTEPINVNQNAWQRTPWPFNASVRIMSGGNAMIANCRFNDLSAGNTWSWGKVGDPSPVYLDDSYDQPGYIAQGSDSVAYVLTGDGKAVFRQSHQYGLSINGLYFFAKAAKAGAPADPWGNPNGWYGSPTSAPWLFREGHVVRDNFLYSTQGAKMEASGAGLKILNNVFRDAGGKVNFYRADGWTRLSGSAFLQRGILMGGSDIVVKGNDLETTKSNNGDAKTGLVTAIQANDGELVMIDNTTTNVSGWTVEDNNLGGVVFAFDTRGVDRMVVRNNTFKLSPQPAGNPIFWVNQGSIASGSPIPVTNMLIENNTGLTSTSFLLANVSLAFNNICRNNTATPGSTLKITLGAFTDVSGNTGWTLVDTPPGF